MSTGMGAAGFFRRRYHHHSNPMIATAAAISAANHHGKTLGSQGGRAGLGTRSALSAGRTLRTKTPAAVTGTSRSPFGAHVTVTGAKITRCAPMSHAATWYVAV